MSGRASAVTSPPEVTYLLPIRLHEPPSAELTTYLEAISRLCPVLVVDGSRSELFTLAHQAWQGFARHVPPAAERA